jgi:DNA repair photolyase
MAKRRAMDTKRRNSETGTGKEQRSGRPAQSAPKGSPRGAPEGSRARTPKGLPEGPAKGPPKGLPEGPPKESPKGPPKGLPEGPPKESPKGPAKATPKESPRGLANRPHDVILAPRPHLLASTSKQIHGWWPGKRDCTSERLLVNPYNGCSHDCAFCYAHALPGRFATFAQHGLVTVCQGFDREVAKQLDSLLVAACGYLSPVTDPFQPLDGHYRLSQGIIRAFVERGLPVEFITKAAIPDEALGLMRGHPHCFGQVSILTLDETRRRALVPDGAATPVLLDNIRRLKHAGMYAVARIDPIIPGLTDDPAELRALVTAIQEAGADHLVASCMDVPLIARNRILERLAIAIPPADRHAWLRRWESLYRERIGGAAHAAEGYRRDLFAYVRGLGREAGMTFALCMEYGAPAARGEMPVGLNREYATARNCEGLDVPVYVRDRPGEQFRPVAGCDGACLWCAAERAAEICGMPELAGGGAWDLAGYRRLSALRRAGRRPAAQQP